MQRMIATILCAMGLTACGTDRPVLVLPPVDLAVCAEENEAPNLPPRDGTDETQDARDLLTLDYILGLRATGGDCRAKVKGLRAWMDSVSAE